MSNITRWEPLRDFVSMRKDMDRLMDEFFLMPSTTTRTGWGLPTIDLYQTDDDVVVKASMPGMNPEDLDIQVIGDTLTIRGEAKKDEDQKERTYHIREHQYQSFSRSVTLPVMVKADKANAEMKNGILTLTLPKADETKPKVISVKAK